MPTLILQHAYDGSCCLAVGLWGQFPLLPPLPPQSPGDAEVLWRLTRALVHNSLHHLAQGDTEQEKALLEEGWWGRAGGAAETRYKTRVFELVMFVGFEVQMSTCLPQSLPAMLYGQQALNSDPNNWQVHQW